MVMTSRPTVDSQALTIKPGSEVELLLLADVTAAIVQRHPSGAGALMVLEPCATHVVFTTQS